MKTLDEAVSGFKALKRDKQQQKKAEELSEKYDGIRDEIYGSELAASLCAYIVQSVMENGTKMSINQLMSGGASDLVYSISMSAFASGVTVGIEMEKE